MQSMENLKKLGKLDQASEDSWKKFQAFIDPCAAIDHIISLAVRF